MKETLEQKIADLKEGDLLDMTQCDYWQQAGLIIERVTDKAILVDGEWIPKSQIVAISYGHNFKGVSGTNDTITECKELLLSNWFESQLSRKAMRPSGAY